MENKNLINKAIQFIQSKPKDMLSLQEVADNVGFSLNYFDAMFRRHTGFSVMQYARIFKLTQAAIALRSTDKTILDISLDYGYVNPENFSRAFKGYYKVSPSVYRKMNSSVPLKWSDRSGKTIISRFSNYFPDLRSVSADKVIDFIALKGNGAYISELTEMHMTENCAFTLDEAESLQHLAVVHDYGNDVLVMNVIGADEDNTFKYLETAKAFPNARVCFSMPYDSQNKLFTKLKTQFSCRVLTSFIYNNIKIHKTKDFKFTHRVLTKKDIGEIKVFCDVCSCKHIVKGLLLAFDGKTNEGLMSISFFNKNQLVGMALPSVHDVNDALFFDIGEIILHPDFSNDELAVHLIKLATHYALSKEYVPVALRIPEDDHYLSKQNMQSVGYVGTSKHLGIDL